MVNDWTGLTATEVALTAGSSFTTKRIKRNSIGVKVAEAQANRIAEIMIAV